MNWKTTLVLLVLVAGLGAFVLYGPDEGTKPHEEKRIVPGFKVDDVTKVVVKRGAKLDDEIVVAKDGPNWKMEKPVADKADDGKIRELLSPIEFLDYASKSPAAEGAKSFGEVQQRLEVSRPKEKGGDFTFELGNTGAASDTRYLRVAGRDFVYLVKKDLSDRLAWDPFELRAKELFTVTAADASKITAKSPSGQQGPNAAPQLLELVRGKDRLWRMGGADGELAEAKRVTEITDRVGSLKAKGLVTDKPTDAELAGWGLQPPEIELSITDSADKTPKTETVQFGKKVDPSKSDERYARFVGRPTVYKVDAPELARDISKDPLSFRSDSLLPLGAGAEGVTLLEAKWKSGRHWKLTKKENDWSFELPGKSKGDAAAVKDLVKELAELKISTRETGSDMGKFGLAEPTFTVTVGEGDTHRTLEVGSSAAGGVYFVRRAGESRVYSSKLGDLVAKLENAPLGARSKQIFKASYWEMTAWKLTAPDGKVESSAEKKGNDWNIPGMKVEDVDTGKVSKAFEPLEALTADALVAEVTSESMAKYGLDKPRTLTVTVESWEANTNSKKKEERTLLIGKREGDSLYVAEKGGDAIGKVKAEFLDLLERGFKKGKTLFEYTPTDCFSMVVKDASGKEIAHLEKKKEGVTDTWTLGDEKHGTKKLVLADVDKLLRHFDKVEGFSIEEASDATKKSHKLAPAERSITFQTKPSWGENKDKVTAKTLLLGDKAGEHDIWAMDEAGQEIGTIYDAPIKKLDEFLAAPPIAKEEPAPPKKADTAPVTSPTTAPVGTPSK